MRSKIIFSILAIIVLSFIIFTCSPGSFATSPPLDKTPIPSKPYKMYRLNSQSFSFFFFQLLPHFLKRYPELDHQPTPDRFVPLVPLIQDILQISL